MKPIQAVILTPEGSSTDRLKDTIEEALAEFSIQPVRLMDQASKSSVIVANEVTEAIQEADIVVVDVSDRNPDVLYKLGFAYGLRKSTLLLLSADSEGELPPDLYGYQIVTYSPNNLAPLKKRIQSFLKYQVSKWSDE